MAFCELKYRSSALQKATAANIILPEGKGAGPFPTLYLLHGLSDDHNAWERRTSIERYVEGLPLIVVMPDGGRGFYCDAKEGMAWETAIVRDLREYVEAMFPARAERSARCLAGLSMGGYGAVKFALKYPDLFCAGVSHSGALAFAHHPMNDPPDDSFNVEFARVVGEHPEGGPDDIFALAEKLDPSKRPALRIDCGVDDFLIGANRTAHEYLTQIGYPHEYEEHPGSHEWGYWDVHIQETLQFLTRQLGIVPG